MRDEWLGKTLFWLGLFVGVAYLIVGVAGAIWPGHWDDAAASDQIAVGRIPRSLADFWCSRDSDCCPVRPLAGRRSCR